MKLGYTEFSYGYAFTDNLIQSSRIAPTGAPQFPNLVQEASLGYDIRINFPAVPLFFQFKLPELMVRQTAREISVHALPISCPFFRMSLMRRNASDQHRLLVRLERDQPGRVFYASPNLPNIEQFNAAYNLGIVHLCSALFRPAQIGLLPDDQSHAVSYMQGGSGGWYCSKPERIEAFDFAEVMRQLVQDLDGKEAEPLADAAPRLLGFVRERVAGRINIDEGALRARVRSRRTRRIDGGQVDDDEQATELRVTEDLLVAHQLARIGLGVELFIAQPKP